MKTQKGNKAIKNKTVSYRSQGRTAQTVNTDNLSGSIIRTGHRIGKYVHAQKYKGLYAKQAQANALIRESRQRLKKGHKELKKISAMKSQFYKSRGIKSTGQLSFKNLTRNDLQAYENLLDAIINEYEINTYLNAEKHAQLRNKMGDIFKETWADKLDDGITVDDIVDVLEDDITDDLKRLGISYREVFDLFADYPNATSGDVIVAMTMFKNDYSSQNVSTDEFLQYADDYLKMVDNGHDFSNKFMRDIFRWYRKSGISGVDEFEEVYTGYMSSDYVDINDYYENYLKNKEG